MIDTNDYQSAIEANKAAAWAKVCAEKDAAITENAKSRVLSEIRSHFPLFSRFIVDNNTIQWGWLNNSRDSKGMMGSVGLIIDGVFFSPRTCSDASVGMLLGKYKGYDPVPRLFAAKDEDGLLSAIEELNALQ